MGELSDILFKATTLAKVKLIRDHEIPRKWCYFVVFKT